MMGGAGSQRRGQSEVLGVVLLFGIVLSMSVLVVVAGGAVMEASQDSVSAEGAAVSMAELDGQVSSMDARTDSSAAATFEGFAGEGSVDVRQGSSMRIEVDDENGSPLVDRNVTLGAVVYERGNEEVAYEGGGVWRKAAGSDASQNVSPPQFEYRYDTGDPTLTLPLVTVTGDATGDDISLRQTGPSTTVLPDGSTTVNPLQDGERVVLTVHSDYYRAWGEFFDDRTDGQVSYDHANRNVTLTLNGLEPISTGTQPDVSGALTAGDVPTLNYNNGAATMSYNSSDPSPSFTGSEGDVYVDGEYRPSEDQITVGGDLVALGKSERVTNNGGVRPQRIEGDAIFAEDVFFEGNHTIEGNFSTQGNATFNGRGHDERITIHGDLYVGEDLEYGADGISDPAFDYVTVKGDVYVGGDVEHFGEDSVVEGDLYVGGDLDDGDAHQWGAGPFGGDPDYGVQEDIYVGGSDPWPDPLSPSSSLPSDQPADPIEPEYPTVTPNDDLIDEKADLEDNNTNDNHPDVIDTLDANGDCSDTCALTAGRYYVEDGVHLEEDDELVFDTTDGPIEIYAEPGSYGLYVSDATIEVRGDDPVNFYTPGDFEIQEDTDESSVITTADGTPGNTFDAGNFRLWMASDSKAQFNSGDPVFTGVLNAPGAEVTLTNHATLYGAVVGQVDYFDSNAKIAFDESLRDDSDENSTEEVKSSSQVRFVHVTTKTVEVSG